MSVTSLRGQWERWRHPARAIQTKFTLQQPWTVLQGTYFSFIVSRSVTGKGASLDLPRAIDWDLYQPSPSCQCSLPLPPLILLLNKSESGDISKFPWTKGELKHIWVGPEVKLFHLSPMRNTKVQVSYPSYGENSQELFSWCLDIHSKPLCWEILQCQILLYFSFFSFSAHSDFYFTIFLYSDFFLNWRRRGRRGERLERVFLSRFEKAEHLCVQGRIHSCFPALRLLFRWAFISQTSFIWKFKFGMFCM